jgi:hypothetical protein
MPYACEYDVPADEQFYRRVQAEIGDEYPKGLVAHVVVKRDGALRHIDVWDSKDEWERFRAERVQPALERVFAAAGFAETPPRPPEEELQLVHVLVGA